MSKDLVGRIATELREFQHCLSRAVNHYGYAIRDAEEDSACIELYSGQRRLIYAGYYCNVSKVYGGVASLAEWRNEPSPAVYEAMAQLQSQFPYYEFVVVRRGSPTRWWCRGSIERKRISDILEAEFWDHLRLIDKLMGRFDDAVSQSGLDGRQQQPIANRVGFGDGVPTLSPAPQQQKPQAPALGSGRLLRGPDGKLQIRQ